MSVSELPGNSACEDSASEDDKPKEDTPPVTCSARGPSETDSGAKLSGLKKRFGEALSATLLKAAWQLDSKKSALRAVLAHVGLCWPRPARPRSALGRGTALPVAAALPDQVTKLHSSSPHAPVWPVQQIVAQNLLPCSACPCKTQDENLESLAAHLKTDKRTH